MNVDQPAGLAPCRCGDSGAVCVKGHDAFYGGVLARRVYVKIYQPPNGPPQPQDVPPSGTPYCTPNADGTWCMGYLSGAVCATAPGPYPDNRIWVWGEFLEQGGQ